MNQLHLASISLKVLGIYSLIRALTLSENLFHAFIATRLPAALAPEESHALLIASSLVPIALLLGAGVFLLLQSTRLAPFMAGQKTEDGSGASITPHVFQSIVFSALGLYFCVSAIPAIFSIAWNLFSLHQAVPPDPAMPVTIDRHTWAYGARFSLQFLLGVGLFFGGRGLSNLWFALLTFRARMGA